MSEETPARRVGADGETVTEVPTEDATSDVITANVPGDDPAKFVTLTLAHPLNKEARVYLGLPEDAKTEVGQQIKVNKNGANAVINAGYATVDPEDGTKVREVLRGGARQEGEPTSEPVAEAPTNPAQNPPQARSTPRGQQPAAKAPAPSEGS